MSYVPNDVWLFLRGLGGPSPDRAEIDQQLGLDPWLPPDQLEPLLKRRCEEWWHVEGRPMRRGELDGHVLTRIPRSGPNGEVEYALHPPTLRLRDLVEGTIGHAGISRRIGAPEEDFDRAIEAWLEEPAHRAIALLDSMTGAEKFIFGVLAGETVSDLGLPEETALFLFFWLCVIHAVRRASGVPMRRGSG